MLMLISNTSYFVPKLCFSATALHSCTFVRLDPCPSLQVIELILKFFLFPFFRDFLSLLILFVKRSGRSPFLGTKRVVFNLQTKKKLHVVPVSLMGIRALQVGE